MPDTANCFASITDKDAKLILYCHGVEKNQLEESEQIKDILTNQEIEYTTKPLVKSDKPIKSYITPIELASYLVENGLEKDHRIIEMASCFSNFFAMGLQKALVDLGYKNITVFGYHGFYVEPNAWFSNGLANLDSKTIIKNKLTNNLYTDESINTYHDARLAKVGYGVKSLVDANKKIREDLCKELNLDLKYLDENALPPIGENNFPLQTIVRPPPKKPKRVSAPNTPTHDYKTRSKETQVNTSRVSNITGPNYSNQPSSETQRKLSKDADSLIDTLENMTISKKPLPIVNDNNEDSQPHKDNKKDSESPKPF